MYSIVDPKYLKQIPIKKYFAINMLRKTWIPILHKIYNLSQSIWLGDIIKYSLDNIEKGKVRFVPHVNLFNLMSLQVDEVVLREPEAAEPNTLAKLSQTFSVLDRLYVVQVETFLPFNIIQIVPDALVKSSILQEITVQLRLIRQQLRNSLKYLNEFLFGRGNDLSQQILVDSSQLEPKYPYQPSDLQYLIFIFITIFQDKLHQQSTYMYILQKIVILNSN